MPVIVVDVMPKAEILDPQGKAITRALNRLGQEVGEVRVGKRFEVNLTAEPTDELLERVRAVAEEVLANTVIEDVVDVRVQSA